MSIAALIGVGVLAASFLVLALAMVMPLRLEVSLQKEVEWRYDASLRPFGRYGPRIDLRSRTKADPKKSEKPAAKPEKRTFGAQRIIPAGLRFIEDLLQHIRIRRASLDARFSLGDPGETGQAFGLLAPLIYGMSASPIVRFDIEPVFDDRPALSGRAEVDLSVVPASLVGPAVRFWWHAFGRAG
ncbi:hypothetical protein AADZ90_010960 [Aestuariibius sp. 2305UL40-4]|uniref:hypothetical protein n=1 Tax=Aestuariibius violaceus TaxID=3234132 RepID=UPI00345EC26B